MIQPEATESADVGGEEAPPVRGVHWRQLLEYIREQSRGDKRTKTARKKALQAIEQLVLESLDDGSYVDLGKRPSLVRSTIAMAFTADGTRFASTHGDHTIKVVGYPRAKVEAVLEGHSRTPWSVHFHPTDREVLASGCIGGVCCIWNVREKRILRRQAFGKGISCVSFHPAGGLLAIVSGPQLFLWNWQQPDAQPEVVFGPGECGALYVVGFLPSGDLVLLGDRAPDVPARQFAMRLRLYDFRPQADRAIDVHEPLLTVPLVIAYNNAGVSISHDGRMLAVCTATSPDLDSFRLKVLSLGPQSGAGRGLGQTLYDRSMYPDNARALTNLSFSSTGSLLLAGFSYARASWAVQSVLTPALGDGEIGVLKLYRLASGHLDDVRTVYAEVNDDGFDEINAALFAPGAGASDGLLYGTMSGRVRLFRSGTSRDGRSAGSLMSESPVELSTPGDTDWQNIEAMLSRGTLG